ncbi:MAG: hypothetical protein O2992_14975 [Gemmatimonadetes bacterium]|jgi:hypothetical protein|nr:hypothetical protein [Gemmatimonadota bacterium]
MKRKHTKTFSRIRQADSNLELRRVEALVLELGGTIEHRGNGVFKMTLNGARMIYDRPHPRPEVGLGLAKRFRRFFAQAGVINR